MKKHSHKHECPIGDKPHDFKYLKTNEKGDWFECIKCGIWVKEDDLIKYEYV